MKKIRVTLTPAQRRFFSTEIAYGEFTGSCEMHGLVMVMDRYQDAERVREVMAGRATDSQAEYAMWRSTIGQLEMAMAEARA